MKTIDEGELDAQLRRGVDLQLLRVCTSGGTGTIPGSLSLPAGIELRLALDARRRTVIYGCGPRCQLAATTATRLTAEGFGDIRLYPGGIDGWRRAGRSVQH